MFATIIFRSVVFEFEQKSTPKKADISMTGSNDITLVYVSNFLLESKKIRPHVYLDILISHVIHCMRLISSKWSNIDFKCPENLQ